MTSRFMNMGRRPALAGLALLAVAAAACSAGSSGPSAPSGSSGSSGSTGLPPGAAAVATGPAGADTGADAADWPTYHRTNDRAGYVASLPVPTRLAPAWTARLDGAVYGQPIVTGPVAVAATENDTVYALDLASGRVRWSRHLGTPVAQADLPCGNIDPLGITGTPAYDSATGTVFVVAETAGARHDLVALDLATGRVRFRTNLDVTNRDRKTEQQRGALAVAGGRVYVPFGGLFGDCGNYVGYVTSVPTGGGPVTRYEVPTAREGGIWAPSGAAVAANGDVYVAVGNGAALGGRYDGADSVLRLSADLTRRISYFAPKNWGSENAEDADLGTTGPLLLPGGLTVVAGKTGDVYLLDSAALGGIDGQLTSVGHCYGFGGMAYAAGAVYVPCRTGLMRIDVAGRSLRTAWQARTPIIGSPVVGGNAVYTVDAAGGVLYVLDAGSGRTLTSAHVGVTSRFASPVLAGGKVLVPTNAGITAVTSLVPAH